jgi:GxxExxY protein
VQLEFSRRGAETPGVEENEVGYRILAASIAVHRTLGPGLLESVYVKTLAYELAKRDMLVEQQVPISIRYERLVFEEAFRADLVVDRKVILEIKSVETVTAAHRKQIQTYLRLTGCRLGYLLNFGAPVMREGVVRVVNGLPDDGRNRQRSRSRSPLDRTRR